MDCKKVIGDVKERFIDLKPDQLIDDDNSNYIEQTKIKKDQFGILFNQRLQILLESDLEAKKYQIFRNDCLIEESNNIDSDINNPKVNEENQKVEDITNLINTINLNQNEGILNLIREI